MRKPSRESFGTFQFVLLIISIYVLVQLLIEEIFTLSPELVRFFFVLDTLACVLFLVDFAINVKRADSAIDYIFRKWGWVDLISSIPMVGPFRAGRAFRLMRLLRLLRAAKSSKYIITEIFSSKANSTLFVVGATCFVLVVLSSIVILDVENQADSNIQTIKDAVWWSIVTISTVGYGDHYPVTIPGQVLGTALIIAGVGLFGTFTAYVSSLFVKDDAGNLKAKFRKRYSSHNSTRLRFLRGKRYLL